MTFRRSARAVRLATALALLTLSACGETSTIDPDATVTISGVVRTAAGEPLTDRPVRLVSGTSGGEAALAAVTLGLACTSGICGDRVSTGTTDGTGTYRLQVQGSDTQTAFGNVRPQVLSVAAPPRQDEVSGASVAARFVVQTETLQLPPLQLVDPELTVRAAATGVAAGWSTTAAGPYTLSFEADSVVPVWQTSAAGGTAAVDGRVLEDSQGRVVLSGGYADSIEGSSLDLTWRSPGVGFAAAAGAPLSRGQACRYETPAAGAEQAGAAVCLLTDGDLVTAQLPEPTCSSASPGATAPSCTTATAAVIELPSTQPAELVVVRGCSGTCAVEVSADGSTFGPAGSVSDPYGLVRLSAGGVRAVRVGLGSAGLREVSLWGPTQRPALKPVPGKALDELRAPYDLSTGGLPLAAVAAAATAALVAVLGLGYALGSRRRRPAGTGS